MIARMALAAAVAGAVAAPAMAEPCNPVIDGTYCATQNIRRSNAPTSSGSMIPPMRGIEGIARGIGPSWDQPATLGAITFKGGGGSCIGLFRRGQCS